MSTTHIEQFRVAIEASGMVPPDHIEPDGRLKRFSPAGKRGDLAGWCVLFDDGVAAGVFGNWKTGLHSTWCGKSSDVMTEAERHALRQHLRTAKLQRDAELAQRHQEASYTAMQRWQAAAPAVQHPYLLAKGVRAHGLRIDGSQLLVPVRNGGVLTSLQTIYPDSAKRFLSGGRTRGGYHAIGTLVQAQALVLAEGYATAATVFEATGLPVAMCFNSGNLLAVARTLRSKHPELALLVAADDDHRTEGNPGITAATDAALSVGGLVVKPQFPAHRPPKATDFNDLAALAGLSAVRACFAESMEGIAPC